MASQSTIKAAIENIVGRYPSWTIGVTDNPDLRKQEHHNPGNWYQWNADSEWIARNVEQYFVDKGMKGDTGGGGNADYVYIFS